MHACMHACLLACMHVCMYVRMCVCVYMYPQLDITYPACLNPDP